MAKHGGALQLVFQSANNNTFAAQQTHLLDLIRLSKPRRAMKGSRFMLSRDGRAGRPLHEDAANNHHHNHGNKTATKRDQDLIGKGFGLDIKGVEPPPPLRSVGSNASV